MGRSSAEIPRPGCGPGPVGMDKVGIERTPTGRPWAGVAANAHSGRGSSRARVERLVQGLSSRGVEARIAWTVAERSELVAQAGRDPECRCLVAAGGDGTVSALINERPRVPVTVLPAGTENLFAQHFGVGKSPSRVAETVAAGRVAAIDLGVAAGRRFALMAGIGFDADVVTRHHLARVGQTGRMRRTHRAAYVEPVLRASLGYRFPALTVSAEGPSGVESLVGATAFVFNLPRYALGLPFAPQALQDDGLLDLLVFHKPGPLNCLRYLWLVARGRHLDRPGVEHRRVRRVSVACSGVVPVQLDGDPGGLIVPQADGSPWSVEVLPRALDVLMPPS